MTTPRRAFVFSREYPPITVGGTSTVARNVAVGLVSLGWEVVVITTHPRSPADTSDDVDGVLVRRTGTDTIYNATTGLEDQSIRIHRRLLAAADRATALVGAPDLVVLPDLFCYPEAAMFARGRSAPLINILLQDFRAITPYDRDTHRVTSGVSADRKHLLALEEKAVHGSDHTVFISEALSDAVTGYYPTMGSAHSVVHLGVDLPEIGAVELDQRWRLRRNEVLAGDPHVPLLVGCGRLVPVKGFAALLTAVGRLGSVTRPGVAPSPPHLALVGVGPEEAHLRQLAESLGLTPRVSFLGDVPRDEALGWMSVADVAVVPSLWESFCYVCAEMMAFGRPVVATAVDSLRELIPSDAFGYPVPVGGPSGARTLAPNDLAHCLRMAFTQPDEARRRGTAARARIAEHFTNDRFARGISALGHELTAAGAYG